MKDPFKLATSLRNRLPLLVLVALVTRTSTGHATNLFSFVTSCSDCATVEQLRATGLQEAMAQATPGMYLVSSEQTARSAYVRVTGMRVVVCSPTNRDDCHASLRNAAATALTGDGIEATDDDLQAIDEKIFGVSRENKIPTVKLSTQYARSFINSQDEELTGGISNSLLNINVNTVTLPIGSVVLVTFDDGSSAQFVKRCNCTDMWGWTGLAWDSQGKRIHRDGTPIANPNTSGNGGGSRQFSIPGGSTTFVNAYSGSASDGTCIFTLSIFQDGVLVSFHKNIGPC